MKETLPSFLDTEGLRLLSPLAPLQCAMPPPLQWDLAPNPPPLLEIIKALPTKMKGTLPSSLKMEGLGSLSP